MTIYEEISAKFPNIKSGMNMEAALRILLDRIIELEAKVQDLEWELMGEDL